MTLDALAQACQQLQGVHDTVAHRVASLDAELADLQAEQQVLVGADEALKAVLQALQQELQQDIVTLVNYGLHTVFPDQPLALSLGLTEKRGGPWADVLVTHRGATGPVLDTFGGGPASVIAFLLRLVTIKRCGLAPVLLLDEPFAMVSANYRDLVARLLRELADKAGLTILMVTHERQEYVAQATHAYEIVETPDGSVCKPV